MEFLKFGYDAERTAAAFRSSNSLIISRSHTFTQQDESLPSLTDAISALEAFENFRPEVRSAAITFYASNLTAQHGLTQETAELHLFWISLRANLGGEST